MAVSNHRPAIFGHVFLIWLPDDYIAIFSYVCEVSIYKRLFTILQTEVPAISLLELLLYNHLISSSQSHLHAGRVLSGLIPVDDICFPAQVTEVTTEKF